MEDARHIKQIETNSTERSPVRLLEL